jgi:hypothetical protein
MDRATLRNCCLNHQDGRVATDSMTPTDNVDSNGRHVEPGINEEG